MSDDDDNGEIREFQSIESESINHSILILDLCSLSQFKHQDDDDHHHQQQQHRTDNNSIIFYFIDRFDRFKCHK
ncbi:hypothetical protein DERP_006277 [Dermatophagoides pteronyssinus]|uniref:Uncharacterized protein n=1 Tax=Dermatophagoides pteronyssinus TaxID=6956 RepID=A0ABQ8IXZ3_DERPT|nr:hypothetical protein DERP_006277 [Dermatophagoides pteronyssinus]